MIYDQVLGWETGFFYLRLEIYTKSNFIHLIEYFTSYHSTVVAQNLDDDCP